MIHRHVKALGVASGWGAQIRKTEEGPLIFREMDLLNQLQQIGIDIEWGNMVHSPAPGGMIEVARPIDAMPLVCEVNRRLSSVLRHVLEGGNFPFILGGDQSLSAGSWPTIIQHHNAIEQFGLIWLDAHMDAHTQKTSESGAVHGMPLAALLGEGDDEFVGTLLPGRKIRPEHICLVGVRSWEKGEWDFLQSLGVRVIFMEEVQKIGVPAALKEALSIATNQTYGFGLSIDLDVFDPEEAPGVGSPESGGMFFSDCLSELRKIGQRPDFLGLEIVEFNPDRDQNDKTLFLIRDLLAVLFSSRDFERF